MVLRGILSGSLAFGWPAAGVWAKSDLAIVLAKNAPANIDPRHYLVSEKLDGVRAVWDGRQLRFRSGRMVAAPAWFLAKLPKMPMDGELWIARGQFDKLSGTVRKELPVDAEWRQVRYQVFELPGGEGDFERRSSKMREIVQAAAWEPLGAVEQFRIATIADLKQKLRKVVAAGGEGLMLHRSDADYVAGRSDVLLKYKLLSDADAEVLSHVAGRGKYAGAMGALEVRTDDGIRFKLGTGFSDRDRQQPPPIGSRVTFTYRELTPKGVPRFASFVRIAQDQ
jgi:DNA ligase-1